MAVAERHSSRLAVGGHVACEAAEKRAAVAAAAAFVVVSFAASSHQVVEGTQFAVDVVVLMMNLSQNRRRTSSTMVERHEFTTRERSMCMSLLYSTAAGLSNKWPVVTPHATRAIKHNNSHNGTPPTRYLLHDRIVVSHEDRAMFAVVHLVC